MDRGTGVRLKPHCTRSVFGYRSETAPGRFEVVVVEVTATGRAKISVSAAHVNSLGAYGMLPNLKCGGVVVNEFRVMRGRKRGSFARGTEGSNPAPSSAESGANLTSSIRGCWMTSRS